MASKLIKNLIFLLIFVQPLFAQKQSQPKTSFFNSQNFNFKENRIFSLDTAYLLSGLKNNGWGLGLAYEQLVLPFLSIKGDFSHTTIFPTSYDTTITTVGISLNTFYYRSTKA